MIKDLFSQKQTLSFEVFPPKKDDEFTNAQNVLHQLSELQPDFISVTYGAGGSRSKRTVELASFIQNSLHIPAPKVDITSESTISAIAEPTFFPLRALRTQYPMPSIARGTASSTPGERVNPAHAAAMPAARYFFFCRA